MKLSKDGITEKKNHLLKEDFTSLGLEVGKLEAICKCIRGYTFSSMLHGGGNLSFGSLSNFEHVLSLVLVWVTKFRFPGGDIQKIISLGNLA